MGIRFQDVTRSEVLGHLANSFEHARGRSYMYMDENYNAPWDHKNYFFDLLCSFPEKERVALEQQIDLQMASTGIKRIMDQGCARAKSLRKTTNHFADRFPYNRFFAYGLSGSLEDMDLGFLKEDDEIDEVEEISLNEFGIHPFDDYSKRDEEGKVRFFGIERDLHTAMKDFPFPLDLVITQNTYYHLSFPWMAFKHTADSLAVGGVAIVKSMPPFMIYDEQEKPIKIHSFLEYLQEDNLGYELVKSSYQDSHPLLAVIKRRDSPFRTHLHIGSVDRGEFKSYRTVYSRNLVRDDLIPIDFF